MYLKEDKTPLSPEAMIEIAILKSRIAVLEYGFAPPQCSVSTPMDTYETIIAALEALKKVSNNKR